jgi:hypothetical protein
MPSCVLSTGLPLLSSIVKYSVPRKEASEGTLSATGESEIEASGVTLLMPRAIFFSSTSSFVLASFARPIQFSGPKVAVL